MVERKAMKIMQIYFDIPLHNNVDFSFLIRFIVYVNEAIEFDLQV